MNNIVAVERIGLAVENSDADIAVVVAATAAAAAAAAVHKVGQLAD